MVNPGFPSGGRQPQGEGAPTYYSAKFSRKPHENEKNGPGVVVASLAPPGSANGLRGGVVDLPIFQYYDRF